LLFIYKKGFEIINENQFRHSFGFLDIKTSSAYQSCILGQQNSTKNMYKYLLFDADNTLFDFTKASAVAFTETLAHYKIEQKEETYPIYTSPV